MNSLKRIAITCGEPAGIGPDLTIEMAQDEYEAQIIALVDPNLLHERAKLLKRPIELIEATPEKLKSKARSGQLFYLPHELAQPVTTGQLNKANSDYVLSTLQTALDGSQVELKGLGSFGKKSDSLLERSIRGFEMN